MERRSGSEALVTRLNSHPQVLCDSEYPSAFRRTRPETTGRGPGPAGGSRWPPPPYGVKILTGHILATQQLPDASNHLRRLADSRLGSWPTSADGTVSTRPSPPYEPT